MICLYLLLDTRIEGNPEIWQAIRSACEADDGNLQKDSITNSLILETAMAILTAVGVKLVNKNLQQAYDSQGK